MEVDALGENEDFSITITRAKFEELMMDLFRQCIPQVERVLTDSGVSKQ